MSYIESIILYVGVLLITLLLAYGYSRNSRNVKIVDVMYLGVVCLPFSVIAGVRYLVGTDYASYLQIFQTIIAVDIKTLLTTGYIEPGFIILVRGLSFINCSDGFIFGALEFITLFVAFYALSKFKYTISFVLSVFIYYVMIFHFSLNIVRQILAASFVLLSVCYLIKGQKIKYVVAMIIAVSIHLSAIVCFSFGIVVAFLKTQENMNIQHAIRGVTIKQIKRYMFYLVILLSPIIIGKLIGPILSLATFAKYAHRINSATNFGIGTIVYSFMYLFPVIALNRKKINSSVYLYSLTNIVLLYISFSFVGYFVTWASRLDIYLLVIFPLYIPLMIGKYKRQDLTFSLTEIYYSVFLSGIYIYDIWFRNINETLPYFFR